MMTTPAGWYDDGSGRQRWWDGQQWTEHFAPVADSADVTAQSAAASGPVEEAVVAPEPAQTWSPPASEQTPQFTAPGETAPTTPIDGGLPPYAAGAPVYPSQAYPAQAYPAAAPAYPGAAPGYQQPAPGYPAAGGHQPQYGAAAPSGPAPMSVLGLVGLGLAVLGTILAFIPVISIVGWILLPAGFIVSLISLFLKGRKWPGITGLIVSVVGTILAVIMAFILVAVAFTEAVPELPSAPPSIGTDEGTDEGFGDPVDVAEGTLGEPVTIQQLSGSSELTVNAATWGTSNGTDFPSTNGGYLTLDITWTGVEGTTAVNPFYMSVETAEGEEGVYDFFSEAEFPDSDLEAGETYTGPLTFDVAQSGSYVVIVSDELFQEVARITVEPSAG